MIPAANIDVTEYLDQLTGPLREPSETALALTVGYEVRPSHVGADGQSELFVLVGLQGAHDVQGVRDPVNIALVIDRSGSMADADRLVAVKQAAEALVSRLTSKDFLSLITYDTHAQVVLPAAPKVSTDQLLAALDGITSGTFTNFSAGLATAGNTLLTPDRPPKHSRILLVSDGRPTAGERSYFSLVGMVNRLRQARIVVSTMGVGHGFDENLFLALAGVGGGRHYFPQTPTELTQGFADEIDMLAPFVASRVRVDVELPEGVELIDVFGVGVKLTGDGAKWRVDRIESGQTRVWLLKLSAGPIAPDEVVANVSLTYRDRISKKRVREERAVRPNRSIDRRGVSRGDTTAQVLRTLIESAAAFGQAADQIKRGQHSRAYETISAARDSVGEVADRFPGGTLSGEATLLADYAEVLEIRSTDAIAETPQTIRLLSLKQRRSQTARLRAWLDGLKDVATRRPAVATEHRRHLLRRDIHRRLTELGTVGPGLTERFAFPQRRRRPTLAVNPFVWSDSSQSVLSRLITNRLVVDLKRAKDFDVVERTQLSADANHGEVTATDLVLLGGVIKLESSMTVTARLVTTADQQIVAGVHITVPRTPGLLFLSQ